MNKKIISRLLLNGKTSISEKLWLKSLKVLYKLTYTNPKKLINQVIINTTPLLKVKQLKQKRRGSRLKEFPFVTPSKNRILLAFKFFFSKTKKRKEKSTHKILIPELLAAANNSGVSINKKKNLYKYAIVKKKFFFYRWF